MVFNTECPEIRRKEIDNKPYRGYFSVERYYMAQSEELRGFGRYELSRRDPGLYRALVRRGKIHLVPKLPHARAGHGKSLDSDERDKIRGLARLHGVTRVFLISRISGHDHRTVRKYILS